MEQRLLVWILMLVCLPVGLVAQTRSPGVSSVERKLVLSYFHDVLDGGKAALVEHMFQPDVAVHRPEGDFTGIAGVRSLVERRKTMYSESVTEVHDIFESGDRVVVRLTHRVKGAGVFRSRIGTHDVNGKSITWDSITIFRMMNGKIAEEWVSRDELGMLLSAGILKAN